jgi:hypothetical protein
MAPALLPALDSVLQDWWLRILPIGSCLVASDGLDSGCAVAPQPLEITRKSQSYHAGLLTGLLIPCIIRDYSFEPRDLDTITEQCLPCHKTSSRLHLPAIEILVRQTRTANREMGIPHKAVVVELVEVL